LSDNGAKSKLQLLQNAEEKTWQKELIPIKELIIDGMSLKDMKNIKALQIWTAESQFSDKTDISFFIEDIALFSIIKPFVDRIGMPCVISKKYKKMPVTLNVLGKVSSDSKIMLSLTNGKGETVREKIVEPDMLKKRVHINISDLPQGLYSIQINGIDVAPEIKKVEVEIIDSIE
jgi:hypothetical protein